ncbi:type II toxin-antitoxin system RelE/ParE family toxin [Candidatus Chloroploca sp. M-50]|jgi:mRNA interferase RelE/StbE|uniref:Type II toxin-antitoxin system RelE/ParE family toxin n=1 Tax=Candidatus Chloroploca mongolica TaxID=2528176 RepID=A0ABS4DE10_9CHLR|nr:type II toxin-antitoxin system RelE/ParE family toxin [Candidatus Chloroploca mongolica]MBP1467670.1 type II toxin-antitoxin system RelE/ParE family toxin [Candidatus Chloroploca mongolica]
MALPYTIILAPEAVEDLQQLKAHTRATVRAALTTHLRYQPTQLSKSRIKRLQGLRRPQYRLRVDDIRVFYDVQEQAVEILAIINKAEADAWLAQFGESEEGVSDEADPPFGSEE